MSLPRKTCLPLSEEFWRVKDQKKYYWHQKKYPKGSRKTGINKKIPLETYTLINHWAHHFLHNCIPIALIANSDANTNASVSRLLLHICRSVCINVWMYACTHVCMYVCIVNVCMHVFSGCMHVYVWRHKHQDARRRIADSGCSSTFLKLCTVAHTSQHRMHLPTKQTVGWIWLVLRVCVCVHIYIDIVLKVYMMHNTRTVSMKNVS